jgi:hypothetical protein
MTRRQAAIFDVLWKFKNGERISSIALMDRAWADDPDGGPECGSVTARTHLWRLRQVIADAPLTIHSRKGRDGHGYRLVFK